MNKKGLKLEINGNLKFEKNTTEIDSSVARFRWRNFPLRSREVACLVLRNLCVRPILGGAGVKSDAIRKAVGERQPVGMPPQLIQS